MDSAWLQLPSLIPAQHALAGMLLIGLVGWWVARNQSNVNLVDSLWPVYFLLALVLYALEASDPGPRFLPVVALLLAWAMRLGLHLAVRNQGKPEDWRYRAMRERHGPSFAWKSLFIVFWLQAGIAWIVAMPLFVATTSPAPLNGLDWAGVVLVLFGLVFESVADRQLTRFRARPGNDGRVMDQGLWRFSRHPNYFGEACVWWGFGLLGLGAGSIWALVSPLLMTWLLLRVSGVALLEAGMANRRPAYADYMRRTSAFLPWPPRRRAQ
ncbi:MAG: DUF1295 domain-containing protein [Pseudomonadota bacterium]